MIKNIFFDLDGTLIDAKQRMYRLFSDLSGQSTLTFDAYWGYKKEKQSNESVLKSVLHFSTEQVDAFTREWMELIEHEGYLYLDTLFEDTTNSLESLMVIASLYVVTARQSEQNAIAQLQRLGIEKYFKNVLVTEQKQTKTDLIRLVLTNLRHSLIIGDTGEETNTGKELDMVTVSVLTGFRNKGVLESYHPDYIFDNLTAFTHWFTTNNK